MTFEVQTLPPTDTANAYIDVAYFRSYWLDRGTDLTATSDATIQGAIVRATGYLDVRFGYIGYRVSPTQQTEWPRTAAFNNRWDILTGIPVPVKKATAEYAKRALDEDLMADPQQDALGQAIKSKSETVGPISEQVQYKDYGGYQLPEYPYADNLLTSQGLVISGATGQNGGLTSGNVGRA